MNESALTSGVARAEEDTSAALQLWIVLSRAQRAVAEQARRNIERYGLGITEFAVLEALYQHGPLTLGEVGEHVLLTSGSTTYVADKLEQRGLLTRRACLEDRRVCYAELTGEGAAMIAEIFPQHAAALRRALSGLTTEEKRIAVALLRRLESRARAER